VTYHNLHRHITSLRTINSRSLTDYFSQA
jgi:hypothetical protein